VKAPPEDPSRKTYESELDDIKDAHSSNSVNVLTPSTDFTMLTITSKDITGLVIELGEFKHNNGVMLQSYAPPYLFLVYLSLSLFTSDTITF
jgi:hypothetical protein